MHWVGYRFKEYRGFLIFIFALIAVSAGVLYLLIVKGNMSPLHNNDIEWFRVFLIAILLAFFLGSLLSGVMVLVDIFVPARGAFFRTFSRKFFLFFAAILFWFAALLGIVFEIIGWNTVLYVIFLTFIGFVYNRIHAYRKGYKVTKIPNSEQEASF